MKSLSIETISNQNLEPLTKLTLELWTECDFGEELENWKSVLNSTKEICYLAKNEDVYAGFIHLTIRNDYVEGALSTQTAYLEGIYVKDDFRKTGLARKLFKEGELWAKSKGLKQVASDTEMGNIFSIEFHHKVGFTETNRIVCFIKDL